MVDMRNPEYCTRYTRKKIQSRYSGKGHGNNNNNNNKAPLERASTLERGADLSRVLPMNVAMRLAHLTSR